MATNTKLVEPLIDALIAIMKANLPAALAKVSASYDDGIPLPIVEDANYYFGERMMVPEYPAIICDFETSELGEYDNNFAFYSHTISMDIVLNSDDESVLARQLARYMRATWAVCYANQIASVNGAPGEATSLKPQTGVRSPLVPSGSAFVKGWRWLLVGTRYDDLT